MAPKRWIGMSPDGKEVVLRRFEGAFRLPAPGTQLGIDAPPLPREAAVLDVETTGLDHETDRIIEIGLRTFTWNGRSGDLLAVGPGYSALQDPGAPLSLEVSRLTGLTDADLAGQRIDWARVAALLDGVEIVVAHNAAFDRPFVDANLGPGERVWACSLRQIDWGALGFAVARLEVLSIYHGFFVDAHRALADADALLHLLSHRPPEGDVGYLVDLCAAALRPSVRFAATGAPFAAKDALKARGYRWQPAERVWQREVGQRDVGAERRWLRERVYAGRDRWAERPIAPHARFAR